MMATKATENMTIAAGTESKGFAFKKKRLVTRPLFKWVKDVERFYLIEEPIFQAKPNKKAQLDKDGKERQPPLLAHVTDLETGQQGQIIVGTVLNSELNSEYPDNGYVGKQFSICQRKIEGRDYSTWDIAEIEVE